jgi:CheY-like chemotaxis protein
LVFAPNGGYAFIAAESGHRGLELAEAHEEPISLSLTDVIMLRMNGRKLAEELTRRRPEIQVVFMSAYASNALDAGGDEIQSSEFLQKPTTGDALFRRVC